MPLLTGKDKPANDGGKPGHWTLVWASFFKTVFKRPAIVPFPVAANDKKPDDDAP